MPTTLALRGRAALIAVALVTLSPGRAHADAVGPPPDSCPPGSVPQSSHAGPLCRPTPDCTSTTTCGGGEACEPVSQCIETRECGGLRPPDSGPCTVEHVVGPCGEGDGCTVGVCRARSVCATTSSSGGGCSCRVAGAHGRGGSLALAATILFALALAARARAGLSR